MAALMIVNKPGSQRRANRSGSDAHRDGFALRLPRDRVLGTMTLAEARRRWPNQVEWGEAAFKDFHRGTAEPAMDVVLWDDGRKDVQVLWCAGNSPEITYGGSKTDVPPGSVKDEALWVHKAGEESGEPTYLFGVVPQDAKPTSRPITRDFTLLGNMVSKNGWLTD